MAFHCRDAADPELSGRYDLVTIFEALHDMSYPVDVLARPRGRCSPTAVACSSPTRGPPSASRWTRETSSASTTGSASCTACRWGWSARTPPGTGTVIREDTVRGYAEQAGFAECEVAPIENDFWRFYLLTP